MTFMRTRWIVNAINSLHNSIEGLALNVSDELFPIGIFPPLLGVQLFFVIEDSQCFFGDRACGRARPRPSTGAAEQL